VKAAFAKHVEGELPAKIGWYHETKMALPGLSVSQTRGVISAAFEVAQVFVRIPFYRVRKRDNAKIVLQLGDPDEFDGTSGILAWSDVVSLRDPSQALIEFDPGDTWQRYFESNDAIHALNVILHEGGHAIGFGHSTVKGGLLNPYYDPQVLTPNKNELVLLYREYPELKSA
jgi:hypothetical protein